MKKNNQKFKRPDKNAIIHAMTKKPPSKHNPAYIPLVLCGQVFIEVCHWHEDVENLLKSVTCTKCCKLLGKR